MRTMPDHLVKTRRFARGQRSLHAFLQQYMKIEDHLKTVFYEKNEGCVYQYLTKDTKPYAHFEAVYSDFQSCQNALTKDLNENTKIACIRKLWIGEADKKIDFYFFPGGLHEKKIIPYGILPESEAEIYQSFEDMWFAFPTPFQHGDLLQFETEYGTKGPFLLDYLCTQSAHFKNYEDKIQNWDTTDMTAYGYLDIGNGTYIYDVYDGYLNLEFCDCAYNRKKHGGD